jgi:hypothetical protein
LRSAGHRRHPKQSARTPDLDHDGTADIITATNRGAFVFWNNWKKAAARPADILSGWPNITR